MPFINVRMGRGVMNYEVAPSQARQGDWIASATDEDGAMYLVFFSGPDAQRRAEEYASWQSSERNPHAEEEKP